MSTSVLPDLQAIEDAARRQMARARIRILNRQTDANYVFFGTAIMNMEPVVAWWCETAATDGDKVYYNPSFWMSLGGGVGNKGDEFRIGVLVHEAMHCLAKHHVRRGDRDPEKANVAMDIAINPLILDSGFKLPGGCLVPAMFGFEAGKSFEWYYARLTDEQMKPFRQPEEGEGCGQGDDGDSEPKPGKGRGRDPGKCGEVIDASPNDAAGKTAAEHRWERIANQAHAAGRKAGNMHGGLSDCAIRAGKPRVDYWAILRQFMTASAKDDYTWSRPNRRHIASGKYLPALHSERIGKIVVTYDSSGSCWTDEILSRFVAEVNGIRDVIPSELILIYHTCQVVGEPQRFENGEEFVIKPTESGGTDHRPVFEWIDEHVPDAEVIICLTDLETSFPNRAPDCPVLWISTEDHPAPFGDVLHIEV